MRIVADEDIAGLGEAFEAHGSVQALPGRAITRDCLRGADVLLVRSVTRVNAALLERSDVRFVGSATSGIDHVDRAWLASRGIAFAYAPGSNATAVAEYVVAGLLELAVRQGFSLESVTLGVIGVGHTGSRVVRSARTLGMNVVENDPPLAARSGDMRYRPMDEVWRQADIVTLHVPLTDDGPHATRGMVDAAWLARLRRGAILVNTSRGEVCDEPALAAARRESQLGGLVVDVWCDEPWINRDLAALADVATPHIAGYSEEAKLAGTRMIYEAFCRWAGVPWMWRGTTLPRRILLLDDTEAGDQRVLRRAVQGVMAIGSGDLAHGLARTLDERASRRAGQFDGLRRRSKGRREFAACDVTGRVRPQVLTILKELGFNVCACRTQAASEP